ncbi:hypothetical protein EVAR_81921_1 [Eumeta japonica]|uniref:Uncharacterized protein n=1 Tax=Eumeta variegata TaxID=151549 RepID=A0A4C1UX05_EUMVA|nr:hypothetical protein EVAR_81921_1 [Eumeta japonica]
MRSTISTPPSDSHTQYAPKLNDFIVRESPLSIKIDYSSKRSRNRHMARYSAPIKKELRDDQRGYILRRRRRALLGSPLSRPDFKKEGASRSLSDQIFVWRIRS